MSFILEELSDDVLQVDYKALEEWVDAKKRQLPPGVSFEEWLVDYFHMKGRWTPVQKSKP